eukprot:1157578-Pelagomonas_calceolata.AAC.3
MHGLPDCQLANKVSLMQSRKQSSGKGDRYHACMHACMHALPHTRTHTHTHTHLWLHDEGGICNSQGQAGSSTRGAHHHKQDLVGRGLQEGQ